MYNASWERLMVHDPIKLILKRRIRKTVDLKEAARVMDCVDAFANAISICECETLEEQIIWKGQCVTKSVLDALIDRTGGYKTMIEISEKSLPLRAAIDQIEQEYSGKRMTIKRITDPNRALAAEKLLKARVARRKQLAQTN